MLKIKSWILNIKSWICNYTIRCIFGRDFTPIAIKLKLENGNANPNSCSIVK